MTTPNRIPLSLVDFSNVYEGERPRDSLLRSVEIAQEAERLGYLRVWYSEHHNMSSVASSTPAVLIAHIAAHTSSIRLGAGGVMLPNHSPYVIAEQFGMLEELHPGRIDLGLGRAPGTDMSTLGRALRRSANAAERFPEDVKELAAFLSDESPIPGVTAVPGAGTNVPLYILGSSLFGASLAAALGLPYAFASHFAPQHLESAVAYYRANYEPSAQHPEPYVIAAANVIAAPTRELARERADIAMIGQVKAVAGRAGRSFTESEVREYLQTPAGQQITGMLKYTAVGTASDVREWLSDFAQLSTADELMISVRGAGHDAARESVQILAGAWGLTPPQSVKEG